jgi:GNAT superfamily N-acetyltransferase
MFQPTADQLRARVGADTEILARPDLLISAGPLREHPWASQVFWTRWDESEVDERIEEVLEFFRGRLQAFVWLVADGSTPGSLPQRLEERGFIRELEGRRLLVALPITGLRVRSDLVIEEALDRRRMEDTLRVDHPDWNIARLRPYVDDRMRRVGTDWHAAVAYLDGRPVGSARWFVHRSLHAVEFMGAETLAAYRNRGVYSSLVAFRVDHAANEGCVAAGIIADSRTSAPILLKRGFQDFGGASFYLWPLSHFERYVRVS